MKASLWYDVDEKLPLQAGYYIAFKGYSMGDNETEIDYYYWDPKRCEWRDYDTTTGIDRTVQIVYWTDADPAGWYENFNMQRRDEVTAAEKDAWNQVLHAVEQYEIVKALTKA